MNKTISLPKYIEIETSKKCNRKCSWCPNSEYNFRTTQELMSFELFQKTIKDLSELKYYGWIALHNYNEPLLNPRIFEELDFIKSNLPEAKSCIFTNGDYLTNEIINQLLNLNLQYLRVTLYPNTEKKIKPSIENIKRYIKKKNIENYNWEFRQIRQGLGAILFINELKIEIISPNLETYNYRGDTSFAVNIEERKEPCFMTAHSSAIDYMGNLKMCCNIYSEIDTHKKYIIGNLKDSSFSDLWFSDTLNEYRKNHFVSNWVSTLVCAKCSHSLPKEQTVDYE